MNNVKNHAEISLFKLTWPIWIENILRVTLSSVDVFMLSFFSEKAVAAVGLINQFVFFLQILFLMIAYGSSILISQHLGAGKKQDAGIFSIGSIVLGFVLALLISIFVCLLAEPILNQYTLEKQVFDYALQFMLIYGACSVFTAMNIVFGTILRSYGYSTIPMIVNIAANVINIIGNYCAIFGPFGLPIMGVKGVALSTVFSMFCACIILIIIICRHKDISLPFNKIFSIPMNMYKKILKIGIPTAGELLSYNVGQIVIMKIVATMGTDAMTAMVYALTLLRYVFISSVAIGNGTQIKVGYLVGAGRHNDAYSKVYRYFLAGIAMSIILSAGVYFTRTSLIHIFTKSDVIFHMVSGLLLVALIHEPGRNFNVIIIPALKGAGDVRFPVCAGMIFMWGIGVLFAYILGITFKMGLIGVWIALTCDEWIRGIVMLFRWKNGAWRSKSLVPAQGV